MATAARSVMASTAAARDRHSGMEVADLEEGPSSTSAPLPSSNPVQASWLRAYSGRGRVDTIHAWISGTGGAGLASCVGGVRMPMCQSAVHEEELTSFSACLSACRCRYHPLLRRPGSYLLPGYAAIQSALHSNLPARSGHGAGVYGAAAGAPRCSCCLEETRIK